MPCNEVDRFEVYFDSCINVVRRGRRVRPDARDNDRGVALRERQRELKERAQELEELRQCARGDAPPVVGEAAIAEVVSLWTGVGKDMLNSADDTPGPEQDTPDAVATPSAFAQALALGIRVFEQSKSFPAAESASLTDDLRRASRTVYRYLISPSDLGAVRRCLLPDVLEGHTNRR